MYIEGSNIEVLKKVSNELIEEFGSDIKIKALVLVVEIDGWDKKMLAYENNYIYDIQ